MIKNSFSILLALLFFQSISAQKNMLQSERKEQLSDQRDTLTFVLTAHNNIRIQSLINGKDSVELMFHTAASSLTLTKTATERMESLIFNAPDTVESWGGRSEARYSENNTLQIGDFVQKGLSIWENEHSGPTTGGKFGPNFFEGKIIEINYDKNILVLHDRLPKLSADYEQRKLIVEDGFLFIEGKSKIISNELSNRFLIHSGFGGTLLFDDEFVIKHDLGTQLPIIDEKSLKDSYGNILKTKKAILSSFSIGTSLFNDIPIGFFEGMVGRQKMSVLGGDLLKRFNILFDLENGYIYLKTNNLSKLPYSSI